MSSSGGPSALFVYPEERQEDPWAWLFSSRTAGPEGVSLGSLVHLSDGRTAIPVVLDDRGMVGLQAAFNFDASLMSIGTPVPADGADSFLLDSRIENGTLRLIALSLNGQVLSAGQVGPIPVARTGASEASLMLTDLVASSVYAQTLDVQPGTFVQPISVKEPSRPLLERGGLAVIPAA